ncbi:hypothetical protein GobsT_07300 [Gemmata obscuriglobus]|uniref:ABC transporter substrate-binding protein n=1 Tax=Gemmata obscuriglobus TaxID=114 RepID=A0A2Z3H8K5_9BACT|nr:hypothetical protein [Gemmata obscuriglobus]AWM40732.1 hypothetical protein C1280_29605 [Gemmata obscuriglobus]QEG25995.1 hypothetical protein GobsT_07300 [Gemmata obscuriglobus]VTS00266.1 ABC transporter substrate-binding protein OS=Spirochaeta sp. JC202 GN=JY97_02410 PE=4 SV=1: SBP_bac_8 [Gemmata obscuriglobus UQM 2246]
MQQALPPIPRNRYRLHTLTIIGGLLLVAALGALVTGCDGSGAQGTAPDRPGRPHEGAQLTFNCSDPAFAAAVEPMIRSWEVRTGAAVTLTRDPMTAADATDLAVLPANRLGEWAEPGHLAPLPLKWRGLVSEMLPPYAERLAAWGDQTQAIPLTGDGVLLVYRADRFADPAAAAEFAKRGKGPLAAPATWDQYADVAAFFAARDKGPSVPPLPADPTALFDLFSRVASSFDRPTLSDKDLSERVKDEELLAFHFEIRTGKPRLLARGFAESARWLAGLAAAGAVPPGASDDPVAALTAGKAVLAIVSLDQLAKLPRENGTVPARFGIAPVPGAQRPLEPGAPPAEKQVVNYVPYFAGGRLGVVRARCPRPELAFELLAELAGPARTAELISTPGLGAGPLRPADLSPDQFPLWLGYGFDPARSQALQDTLRGYLAEAVKNPTLGLRGPDREALTRDAAAALRKLGSGAKPADVLAEAQTAWNALDAKAAGAPLVRWRKRAAGLN